VAWQFWEIQEGLLLTRVSGIITQQAQSSDPVSPALVQYHVPAPFVVFLAFVNLCLADTLFSSFCFLANSSRTKLLSAYCHEGKHQPTIAHAVNCAYELLQQSL